MKLGLVPIDRGEEEDTVAADGRREEEGVEAAVDTNWWHLPSTREWSQCRRENDHSRRFCSSLWTSGPAGL